MKILVVGASSFIGRYLTSTLKKDISKNVIGTYFQHKTIDATYQLDIQNSHKLKTLIYDFLPDVIFWIAGNKNLKITEISLDSSREINTYPIKTLLECIDKISNYNPRIIFFSTDYVFDGKRGLYTQDDIPSPTTNYGISNYEAELELLTKYDKYLIFRTSAVMGEGGTFFDFLLHALCNQSSLELFDNILFSPTPIHALTESIQVLLEYPTPATLHLSADMAISRYDFGVRIQEALNQQFKINKRGKVISTTEIAPSKAKGYFLPNLSLKCSEVFLENIKKYQEDFSLWLK